MLLKLRVLQNTQPASPPSRSAVGGAARGRGASRGGGAATGRGRGGGAAAGPRSAAAAVPLVPQNAQPASPRRGGAQ